MTSVVRLFNETEPAIRHSTAAQYSHVRLPTNYYHDIMQVYDAKTMSSKPVAVVAMQQHVPLGFHALFVHQEQLAQQNMNGTRYTVTGELIDDTLEHDDDEYVRKREKEMVST